MAAHVPTGMSIVADVRQPVWCQGFATETHHLFPDRVWHPRIDAVRQDEIKLAELRAEIQDVLLAQLDVLKAERVNRGLTLCNLPRRQIHAREPGTRQRARHRYQVVAPGAADLQHPAVLNVGGRNFEDAG